MYYAITAIDINGQKLYWRKWTSDSKNGRPKWVKKLTLSCLYKTNKNATDTATGKASTHFELEDEHGQPLHTPTVITVTHLP